MKVSRYYTRDTDLWREQSLYDKARIKACEDHLADLQGHPRFEDIRRGMAVPCMAYLGRLINDL